VKTLKRMASVESEENRLGLAEKHTVVCTVGIFVQYPWQIVDRQGQRFAVSRLFLHRRHRAQGAESNVLPNELVPMMKSLYLE
jgi:hypothetical protein